MQSQVAGKNFT